MALPTIKVAISNGHFQESLQNYGDRGIWTSDVLDGSNTILTDTKANWVTNEWQNYSCVVDTNGTNNVATIVSNTSNTLTVSGNQTSLVTAGTTTYRIAGGLTGTVTANASSSNVITVSAVKNKWDESKTILTDELIGMKFVPDRLDGTAYTITDNTATTITIDTSIVVTATTFEVGRGASASVYPEQVQIDGEINEPKQLSAKVIYDVVGTNKFEQETDIDNPLMLGSLVRVTESTGGKVIFEGHIQDAPTDISYEQRSVSFTAYDKLAILEYTMIPGNRIAENGALPSYSWTKKTPLIEVGGKGWESDNKIYQTKGFQDFCYVPQPLAIPTSTTNGDGTWSAVQITNTITGTSKVFQYSTGGLLNNDLIKPGCVVLNLTRQIATYIDTVDSDTQITTMDEIWQTGNKFVIMSSTWQIGEGVTSDSDYTAGDGYAFNTVLREAVTAPANNESDTDTAINLYVGRSSGSDRDKWIDFAGRAWVMITDGNGVEFVHYSGNLKDYEKDKYYLKAWNDSPAQSTNSRGDLTNSWYKGTNSGGDSGTWTGVGSFSGGKTIFTDSGADWRVNQFKGYTIDVDTGTGTTVKIDSNTATTITVVGDYSSGSIGDGYSFGFELGKAYTADHFVVECYPNRLGSSAPLVYTDSNDKPFEGTAAIASESLVQFPLEEDNRHNGRTEYYSHQYSYDGDASSSNPDKGTSDDSVDITDIAQIAITGLTDKAASLENILEESKQTGGAGLVFDTSNSKKTGVYLNNIHYKAFEDGAAPREPKSLINKVCDDAGLLYDLRYDDNTEKVIFKPLTQNTSAHITIPTGSVVSLARERDISDVYSGILLNFSMPEQNFFAPQNVAQHGTGINSSGSSAQSGFTKGSYSSGASPPDYFWDITHLRGLGPDVKKYDDWLKGFGTRNHWAATSVWKKCTWDGDQRIGVGNTSTLNSSNEPLHLLTMWWRGGASLDIESFIFKCYMNNDGVAGNGAIYRVEVSTDFNASDPLSSSTNWQYYNDESASIEVLGGGKEIGIKKCDVKGVNGLRILAVKSSCAPGNWIGEGRQLLRREDADAGYRTYGFNSHGYASEVFDGPIAFNKIRKSKLMRNSRADWNADYQDANGYSITTGKVHGCKIDNIRMTTAFKNAINNTDQDSSGNRAGYAQLVSTLTDFAIQGVGKKALFIRTTKRQSEVDSVERDAFSPSYKKVANMGYKMETVNLENFSESEAQSLGQQFLDDKLRRYQARDYALNGKSPFLNSNDIPHLGQTIKIVDDDNFTGVLTSYSLVITAEATTFDFRLEDYDRMNTAQYIQAS